MPNNEQGFDLERLKTDPQMWMRLAMLSKNGDYLENVFKDKENPFEKNDQAAVETLQKLAAEGKLYLRERGRSRHFQKVERDGDKLKLGAQHEMELSNNTGDLVYGGLMRLSRSYFKWIGLEGISNWFDKRLTRRSELQELETRYKEEYKSFTKEEKKTLKALRKHEENLKKLDEAKDLSNATKKNLDEIRGKETTETLEELEAMLAKADQRAVDNQSPEKQFARRALYDHEENLQKVGEARKNANEKKKTLDEIRGKETTETLEQLEQMLSNANQIERRRGGPLSDNARKARRALRDYVKSLRELKKTENSAEGTKKKLDETLGRETTETIEQLKEMLSISPEEVNERRAIRRHVENLRKQEKAQKEVEKTQRELDALRGVDTTNTKGEMDAPLSQPPTVEQEENTMQPTLLGDQPVQNQIPVPPKLDVKQDQKNAVNPEITDKKKEKTEEKENSNRIIFRGVEYTAENINELPENIRNAVQQLQNAIEQYEREQKQAKTNAENKELPLVDITSPISQPPEPEPEKVSIQPQQMEQQTDLQKRLAAEKEAMDSVVNWKDRLANTLFSNEGVSVAKKHYETVKDKPAGPDFLAGTVCGLLSAAGDPESSKQILEGLVGGKPLGSEYDNRINEGVTAYNRAVEQMNNGNREPMTKLITDAALALGRQASQEDSLSPRHVMIGRMISNAMSLADQHDLRLKFNEEQWATIRGAYQLSKLAQNHHDAKQFLGKEPMDVASEEGRAATRDLLMGNAVEKMIQLGKYHKQEITDVQLLMGCGCLNVDKLTKMMSSTQIRKDITPEQVKEALEMPNGYDSARMAKQLGEELLTIAREDTAPVEKNKQMDMQKQNEPEKAQQLPPLG